MLSFAVLPRELVAFCVTAAHRGVARRPIAAREIERLAEAFARGDPDAARQLHELLIDSSLPALSSVRSLIVVGGPPLDTIPLAALYDPGTRRFLAESWSVAVAPSASSLVASPATPALSAVAVALPTSARDALPESVAEVADVARLYRSSAPISPENATFPAFAAATAQADVIHVASHTEKDPATDEFAFTFVDERVSWRTITTLKLRPTATVLLSACETLQRLRVPDARTLSLGGGFLAAGASDVIGTLAPIRDADARELFLEVHRRLAAGDGASDAVRGAQIAAIANERSTGRPGAWRAVALLTRRIPQRGTS